MPRGFFQQSMLKMLRLFLSSQKAAGRAQARGSRSRRGFVSTWLALQNMVIHFADRAKVRRAPAQPSSTLRFRGI